MVLVVGTERTLYALDALLKGAKVAWFNIIERHIGNTGDADWVVNGDASCIPTFQELAVTPSYDQATETYGAMVNIGPMGSLKARESWPGYEVDGISPPIEVRREAVSLTDETASITFMRARCSVQLVSSI